MVTLTVLRTRAGKGIFSKINFKFATLKMSQGEWLLGGGSGNDKMHIIYPGLNLIIYSP